jgi:hypothetical protein
MAPHEAVEGLIPAFESLRYEVNINSIFIELTRISLRH